MKDKWPKIEIALESEPKFLFILTPPYSGSTALAKLLNTSRSSMILQERAEGQWLIPGMCESDRWDPEKYIDWDSVRSVWLSKFQLINSHVETISLIIEKSPPNLVRARQLRNNFPRSIFMAFNRDPYANCSSIFHRNHVQEGQTREQRTAILRLLAEEWIFRSQYVKQSVDDLNTPHFTYEQFCENASSCIMELSVHCPEIVDADIHAPLKIKEYRIQTLLNHNARQIGLLDSHDLAVISSVLEQEERLLEFFGYKLLI